jgi:hypothetical protein
MVEDIEHLGAKLQIEAFGDLCVFGDREIGVDESRSSNGVAAKGPGMARARHDWIRVAAGRCWSAVEQAGYSQRRVHAWPASRDRRRAARGNSVERFAQHGILEVIRRVAGCSNWPENVGPHGKRNAWARSDRQRGIQRIAGLRLEYQANLPAGDQAVACKWQLIEAAEREAMAGVELGRPIVAAWVVGVLNDVGLAGGKRVVVERLRVGVGSQKFQAMRHVLVHGDPWTVVIGISVTVDLVDGAVRAIGIGRKALRRNDGATGRQRRVGPRGTIELAGTLGVARSGTSSLRL